ncbi:MAG TPA: protein kinase, partial [Myxococcota bacterium]|nr:protein kinase [Myxococcota bacterium]
MARILSLPLALGLIAVGGFGLLASLAPDAAPTDAARDGLYALHRALVDAQVPLPRDGPRRLEEWVAGPVLRYALLPLGLALLAFVAGLVGGGQAPPAPREGEAPDSRERAAPDKRAARKLVKQAQALKKQGRAGEAGELLWSHDLLEEAAAIFIEAGEFVRAAEIRHDQNRFLESAELHLQGESYESAGAIFAQQEEWARAADCYLKADHKSVAAEMFEKAEMYREAARCYRETEFMRHAAAMFVKCKQWLPAAECLERVFVEEGGKATMDPKKAAELAKLVRQAGKLFLKAGEPERAYKMFDRGDCSLEAGEVASRLGDHEAAAAHFRQAGEFEQAANALREAGQPKEAARLLGQHLRDRGDNERATGLLEEAGDHMEAGDLYRSLEQYERAGACYEEHHGYAQAAEMFQLAGLRERAGEAFERAGRFTEAAECFALAGQPQREAELLEQAGEYLQAGETYHREGLDDAAIPVLQKVAQDAEGFGRAAAILGEIFAARGQLPLAITKLQQAIGDSELTRDSVGGFYRLATIYHEDGKHREALELYEKVLAFDYHYADVESRLAEVRELVAEQAPPATSTNPPAEPGAPPAIRVASAEEGRYRIIGELGRGGMGIVYKVQDTVLDRIVAFKVLPQALTGNPQAINNFMREAQAAAKLNHPNIVTVYDTGEQDGHYYIAMEYVEGTTLKEILRRKGAIAPAGVLHV